MFSPLRIADRAASLPLQYILHSRLHISQLPVILLQLFFPIVLPYAIIKQTTITNTNRKKDLLCLW